jgi:internalin A
MSKTMPTRKRRWLQFSLRSLFVVTTLLAVWIGYHVNRARNQQKAVETVLRLGGTIKYDYQFEEDGSIPQGGTRADASRPGPKWLRGILGDEFFCDVVHIYLAESAVTDEDLERLRYFPKLRWLSLDKTQIDGSGLTHIERMRSLKSLSVQQTNVDDEFLTYLRHLTELRHLGLARTRVTGRGLENLKELQQLDTLWLSRTDVTDADVQHIVCLRNLEDLNLGGTKISDEGARQLKELPRLGILWLHHTDVGDKGLAHLKEMRSLGDLDLGHTQVSDAALDHIKDIASHAEEVNIRGTKVTPAGYDGLKRTVPKYRVLYDALDLSVQYLGVPCTNAALQQWLDKLLALNAEGFVYRFVSFEGQPITDTHLDALAKVRGAEVIDLRGTKVSAAGVEELQKALPGCAIWH